MNYHFHVLIMSHNCFGILLMMHYVSLNKKIYETCENVFCHLFLHFIVKNSSLHSPRRQWRAKRSGICVVAGVGGKSNANLFIAQKSPIYAVSLN